MSFTQTLTVLFIGLKLSSLIAWPWLWVLSPIWIPFAIGCVLKLIVRLIDIIAKES